MQQQASGTAEAAPGQTRPGPLVIVISSPSGGGKTTLCQRLLAGDPRITRAITCTTRPPRRGERDGVDYHFLDEAAFLRRVGAREFLEHARVYGHYYGTLKHEVHRRLEEGRDVLLNIDVQGAAAVRALAAKESWLRAALVTVFLMPTSLAVLEARLRQRGQDSEAVIQQRLEVARAEIAQWLNFDYVIVSDSIAADVARMQAIVTAERLRSHRAVPPEFLRPETS